MPNSRIDERVVVDRDRITGGGVTAGIDFGLVVVCQLCGVEVAQMIQLLLQYEPQPPFNAGSPEMAGEKLVEQVKQFGHSLIQQSLKTTQQVAAKLKADTYL